MSDNSNKNRGITNLKRFNNLSTNLQQITHNNNNKINNKGNKNPQAYYPYPYPFPINTNSNQPNLGRVQPNLVNPVRQSRRINTVNTQRINHNTHNNFLAYMNNNNNKMKSEQKQSMPALQPQNLVRAASLSLPTLVRSSSSVSRQQDIDWHLKISIEERIDARKKILEAYKANCFTLEDLLETAAAIDEELIFQSSSCRLDYLKSPISWNRRLLIKRKQLGLAKDVEKTVKVNGKDVELLENVMKQKNKRSISQVTNSSPHQPTLKKQRLN